MNEQTLEDLRLAGQDELVNKLNDAMLVALSRRVIDAVIVETREVMEFNREFGAAYASAGMLETSIGQLEVFVLKDPPKCEMFQKE